MYQSKKINFLAPLNLIERARSLSEETGIPISHMLSCGARKLIDDIPIGFFPNLPESTEMWRSALKENICTRVTVRMEESLANRLKEFCLKMNVSLDCLASRVIFHMVVANDATYDMLFREAGASKRLMQQALGNGTLDIGAYFSRNVLSQQRTMLKRYPFGILHEIFKRDWRDPGKPKEESSNYSLLRHFEKTESIKVNGVMLSLFGLNFH